MSNLNEDGNYLSETLAEQGAINNNAKLVPVAESIRYRKRAQLAEQETESLTEELKQSKSQADEIAKELDNIKTEQQLTKKLVSAGAVDLEAAMLVAKARIKNSDDVDTEEVIEQLKREKQYLFAGSGGGSMATVKTAAARERMQAGHTVLGRAAKKAAVTGNRTDLQEYLRLRRNYL